MSDDVMNVDQFQGSKAQALHSLTTGTLGSSLSKLSGSSRGIPSNKDFHFFYNFDEFKAPVEEISRQSQSMLESIGSSARVWGKEMALPEDIDDAYDWLVNMNDEVFERFDMSVDEFQRIRKEEETGRSTNATAAAAELDNGFQLVCGKKKKAQNYLTDSVSRNSGGQDSSLTSGVKVVKKDKKTIGAKPKVPFHIPTIRRPQDQFNILVNNLNQPFEHVWLQKSEDGLRFIHPLENLSVVDFIDKSVADVESVKPPLIECTPFKLVEEVRDLKELAAKLRGENEFAVDLEHNQYRSFQGLTCLMQISTRTEDFVVDALKLRIHIGPYLREVFKDPTKRKVMHGADRDIVWLQRDFGIYVCNLFDTGQASKVLKLERNSLEYLLLHFCGVTANKEYQNADWRLRPLPEEMLRYAREDTHYLLHIYDLMRIKLLTMSEESEQSDALLEVYKRSYDLCMQLYEKELLTENSYLYIYGLQGSGFNAQQLAIVAGLCEWRDVVARAEDESTGYILPNKTLLEIAKQMPVTTSKLRQLVRSKHPYTEQNLGSVVSIIRHSMQNAAAFEAAAEHLKVGCTGMVAEENMVVEDGTKASSPDTLTNPKTPNTIAESSCVAIEINGDTSAVSTASQMLKESSVGIGCTSEFDSQGGSSKVPGESGSSKIESDSHISGLTGEHLTASGLRRDENANTSVLDSEKVTGATVQVQKKPNRAFGALFGSTVPKRKLDPSKKDKEEIKLDQIRSSVNFPFHSFSGGGEQSKPTVVACVPATQIPVSAEHDTTPPTSSKAEDIIMLEGDNEFEESRDGNSETTKEDRDSNLAASASEIDKDNDEPMSLSDLSSSFQQCFESFKPNRKARQVEKPLESGGLQLKPFNYEAARRQVMFGSEKELREGEISVNDSGGKKKSSVTVRAPKDDGSRELAQGKRRQAFPATGNRSATFR
ncbi:hypothetical protein FNV43_RR16911 [Rhamnella rubrinervis]|uniref:HRDC domain-containing protein n=1 Tax=Rhamnella rubrinervis TaxID=2594499 RepID=A0A8K0GZS4_9ROSA|nr:hypothetical protein FNV43_RR16911 [Rhamnella rubrinervis]